MPDTLTPNPTSSSPATSSTPSTAAPDRVTASEACELDDRARTIAEIRRINPTATLSFLRGFDTPALRDYLEHLRHAKHKHVRLPGWLQRRTAQLNAARAALKAA